LKSKLNVIFAVG